MPLEVDIEKKLNGFSLRAQFSVDNGITGILGASGSGKSLALKCIAGIERPDRGRIVLDGLPLYDSEKRICLPPQKRQVGYLFQNYALFPHMTVRKNILCGLHQVGNKAEREALLAEALKVFQLEQVSEKKPAEISGGEAQRTALARILVNRPKVLLLDEPFSALDTHLKLQLQVELKQRLSAYGGAVLMVTHSRDEAYHMCRSIIVTDQGTFDPLKSTRSLFADPESFAAARITGCKNIAPARKTEEYEVEVPAWNVRFTTRKPVLDGLKGVAFRAHYLNPRTGTNSFPVIFAGEMEEPFEVILLFHYEGQDQKSPPIWWRLPKDKRPQVFPERLGIAPANILLLYR